MLRRILTLSLGSSNKDSGMNACTASLILANHWDSVLDMVNKVCSGKESSIVQCKFIGNRLFLLFTK